MSLEYQLCRAYNRVSHLPLRAARKPATIVELQEYTVDPIRQIFNHLDRWWQVPNYQLERRADIFFSVYMREVLETNLGYQIREEFVPEFPVRIGSIGPYK